MDNLSKQIEKIIFEQFDQLNEKIKGINLLESFKLNLLEKIKLLVKNYDFKLKNDFENDININKNDKNISAKIKFVSKPSSILKQLLNYDTLIISLNEQIKLDIYLPNKENEFVNFSILPMMGVTLPKNTIININFLKDAYYLEIMCKNILKNIEIKENDII